MSTHKPEIKAEPLALLFLSLLWFFDGEGLFAALVPAAAVHELGHLLLLRRAGLALRRINLGLFGLEMDYRGVLHGTWGALALLAGPLFGLAYALLSSLLPGRFWALSGGVSLALSLVNLLPVLPLDGGRLLILALPEKGRGVSRVFSLCIAVLGAVLSLRLHTLPPLAMGLWLLWNNIRNQNRE